MAATAETVADEHRHDCEQRPSGVGVGDSRRWLRGRIRTSSFCRSTACRRSARASAIARTTSDGSRPPRMARGVAHSRLTPALWTSRSSEITPLVTKVSTKMSMTGSPTCQTSCRALVEHRAEDRVGEQEADVVRPLVVERLVRKRGEHRAEALVGALAELPVGEDVQVVAADASRARALRIPAGPSRAASWGAPRAPARAPCSRSRRTARAASCRPRGCSSAPARDRTRRRRSPLRRSRSRSASESPITAALAVM